MTTPSQPNETAADQEVRKQRPQLPLSALRLCTTALAPAFAHRLLEQPHGSTPNQPLFGFMAPTDATAAVAALEHSNACVPADHPCCFCKAKGATSFALPAGNPISPAESTTAAAATRSPAAPQCLDSLSAALRAVYRYTRDAVAIIANDSYFFLNTAYSQLFGYPPEELLGKPCNSILPCNHRKQQTTALFRSLAATGHWHGQVACQRKDGTPISAIASITKISAELTVICFPDINGHQKTNSELKLTLERIAMVGQVGLTGTFVYDAQSDTYAGDNLLKEWFGLDRTTGITINDLLLTVHPEDTDKLIQGHACITQSGELSTEYRILHNGYCRYLHCCAKPVYVSHTHCVVGILQDITAKRRADELLQNSHAQLNLTNSELKKAAVDKDQFLANVSHELRTPLTSILGLSSSLRDGKTGPLTDKQTTYATHIYNSGDHLLHLINDLLDITKFKTGKFRLNYETCNLLDVCQNSLSLVAPLAAQNGIAFETELPTQPILLRADPTRLKQMLVNLLSNAIKFTPTHKRAGLLVKQSWNDRCITISVWDEGIGIATHQLPLVFEPFTQVHTQYDRGFTGSGLGLALTRNLTDLHGGSLTVESLPSLGSRFTIKLPWAPDLQTEDIPPAENATNMDLRGTGHIIIAEDNSINADMFQSWLQDAGYSVKLAANGSEAVVAYQQRQPDLVLMDVQMPIMDGIVATQQIRTLPGGQTTPIIALTALALPTDRERSIAAGVTEYLVKPCGYKTLLSLIQRLLTLQRQTTL